jgi:hypothetical protein
VVANNHVEPTFAKHVWEFDLPVEGNETFGVQGFDLLAQGVVCIEINELIKGALNQRTTCRPLLLPILELGACEKRYWKYCADAVANPESWIGDHSQIPLQSSLTSC